MWMLLCHSIMLGVGVGILDMVVLCLPFNVRVRVDVAALPLDVRGQYGHWILVLLCH